MAQFDVHRATGGELVVDCQADLLREIGTRFVIPLRSAEQFRPMMGRLNPTLLVEDVPFVLAPQFARTVKRTDLGPALASLAEHDLAITGAIDMLVGGY